MSARKTVETKMEIELEHANFESGEIAFNLFIDVLLSINSEHILTEIDCSECWNVAEKTNNLICSKVINTVLPDHNSLKRCAWTQSLAQSTGTFNSKFVVC